MIFDGFEQRRPSQIVHNNNTLKFDHKTNFEAKKFVFIIKQFRSDLKKIERISSSFTRI